MSPHVFPIGKSGFSAMARLVYWRVLDLNVTWGSQPPSQYNSQLKSKVGDDAAQKGHYYWKG